MKRWMALAAGTLVPLAAVAQEDGVNYLGEMVVTAPAMSDPLTVETDPKAPRQPVPAGDGADFLKNIPGFSSVRKGGTSGDPVFRGLGGSRLNIVQDGAYVFGGCGQRMDPPTAYTYPESFDKVTVLKGPQSVLYGGGNVAGTVLFERITPRFEEAGTRFMASGMVGSFGRNDQMVDFTGGASQGFLRVIGTRSQSDNYEDGDGNEVHSEYERWSGTAIVGWTPDDDTRVEFNVDRSDGEAAYADRAMDGVVFEREAWGVKASRANLSPLVQRIEAQYYHSYVDHVMDNFSLRTLPPMMMPMESNPDRETNGARLVSELAVSERTLLTVGADYRSDEHSLRMGPDVSVLPRTPDLSFEQAGLFAELEHAVGAHDTFVAGLRIDRVTATAERGARSAARGTEDEDTTRGGFVRYEHALSDAWRLLAGSSGMRNAPPITGSARAPSTSIRKRARKSIWAPLSAAVRWMPHSRPSTHVWMISSSSTGRKNPRRRRPASPGMWTPGCTASRPTPPTACHPTGRRAPRWRMSSAKTRPTTWRSPRSRRWRPGSTWVMTTAPGQRGCWYAGWPNRTAWTSAAAASPERMWLRATASPWYR